MEHAASMPTMETLKMMEKQGDEVLTDTEVEALREAYDFKPDKGKGEELSEAYAGALPDPYGLGQVHPLGLEATSCSLSGE